MNIEKGIRDIGMVINKAVTRCNYANRFGYYSVTPGGGDTIEIEVCGKDIWLEMIREFSPSPGDNPGSGPRLRFPFSGFDIEMVRLGCEGESLFIIREGCADVRSEPDETAELVTQAILGDEARVFAVKGEWSLVRLEDGYTGWVKPGRLRGISRRRAEEWKAGVNSMVGAAIAKTYRDPEITDAPSGELLAGTLLRVEEAGESLSRVALPCGGSFFVKNKDLEAVSSERPDPSGLVRRARSFIGLPYLWGGTTPRGFDCSGLVKRLFQMEGIQLPRDSDLQAKAGEEIGLEEALRSAGSLLFFSESGRGIDHVALSTGDRGFIHSSGRVRPGSMSSKAEAYDRELADSFRKAVKILG